jgi:hypothetical protein
MSIWSSLPGIGVRASDGDGSPDELDNLDVDVACAWRGYKIRLGLWSDRKDGIDAAVYLSVAAARELARRLQEGALLAVVDD